MRLEIEEPVNLDELNLVLSQNECNDIEYLLIEKLIINKDDIYKINFPVSLKYLFVGVKINNMLFMDDEWNEERIINYLCNEFTDLWKIPFGCKFTYRLNHDIYKMYVKDKKAYNCDKINYAFIISDGELNYMNKYKYIK